MSATDRQPAALPETGFVRINQLVGKKGMPAILPFSAATLWRMVAAGKFPAPVKLSAGVTAWRVEEVRGWIAQPA